MKYQYLTKGTCSRAIEVELEEGKIKSVEFYGGCPGNLLGISKLVVGMTPEEVIAKFAGVGCGGKPTSCPDQLARALQQIVSGQAKAC